MKLKKEQIVAACRSSSLPCVHIRPDPDVRPGPADSKFGGDYYLPAGAAAPEMEFLAQINFAQLPRLEGFPEAGLLQFFLRSGGEMEEQVCDDFAWQADSGVFQAVYHPDPAEGGVGQDLVPETRWFSGKAVGGMRFEPAEEIATLAMEEEGGFLIDLGYEALAEDLMPVFQAAWKEDGEDSEEEDEEDGGEEEEGVYDLSSCGGLDQFIRELGNWGFKAGGHPALRQCEFRLDDPAFQDYTCLLFQYDLTVPDPKDPMDLEKDTFCFFIKPEDLKACRFDDLLLVHHNCY